MLFVIYAGYFVFLQVLHAQLVTTNTNCIHACVGTNAYTHIFLANNLRNFEKLVLETDQFCNAHNEIRKCSETCNESDKDKIAKQLDLSDFVCGKIEEFRLARECMQNQNTNINTVGQCLSSCGQEENATFQLDASPSAIINPFTFINKTSSLCQSSECTIRCSIFDLNKKCSGSGEIFKDLALKQVSQAGRFLNGSKHNDGSSATTKHLVSAFLKTLPDQCTFIVEPSKFEEMFSDDNGDNNEGSSMVTAVGSLDEVSSETFPLQPSTMVIDNMDSLDGDSLQSSSAVEQMESRSTTRDELDTSEDRSDELFVDESNEAKKSMEGTSAQTTSVTETRPDGTERVVMVNDENVVSSVETDSSASKSNDGEARNPQKTTLTLIFAVFLILFV